MSQVWINEEFHTYVVQDVSDDDPALDALAPDR